jgi:cytochrome c biogenesis protein CcmG/thiol:disulfide interchange protein DsbE
MSRINRAALVALLCAPALAADAKLIEERHRPPAPRLGAGTKGKVVLVNFWASWCAGCKTEMPQFQAMLDANQDRGFAVLGMSLDETPQAPPAGVTYPSRPADPGAVEALGVRSLPVTLLVDRKGRIAARYDGVVERADVEAKVRDLVRGR